MLSKSFIKVKFIFNNQEDLLRLIGNYCNIVSKYALTKTLNIDPSECFTSNVHFNCVFSHSKS